MERKTKSAFKLRSGNKPSIAMFKLFSGPQHSRTRDTFKRIKQKIGDAATYTKAYLSEAFRNAGADNFKYPGRKGREAVQRKKGIHHTQLKPNPKGKRSTLDAVKKAVDKEKKRKAEIKRKKTPSHSVSTPNPPATTHKFSHKS